MKKIIGLFLAAAAWSVFAGTEGTVAVSVLNARKEPTVKSPVLMRLKSGRKVSIVRRCGENWLEIEAPADAPVYVDESLVVGGKAHRNIRMFSGRGRKYPVWGELRKGEKVELQDDRAYGWVRITPPASLRLYVVALYIDGADAVKSEAKPAAKPEAKPEDKTAAKPETKPETKPEAKPEEKPAAKPEDKPAAKPAAKPEAKPAAKPEAKPAAKPAAKPEAKPATKPAVKPAAKPAAAAAKSSLKPFKPDAALAELRIKPTDKGRQVKRTGVVFQTTGSLKAAKFLLSDDRSEVIGFIYYPGKEAVLKKLVDQRVTVQGTEFRVPEWKHSVIAVQELEVVR